MGRVTVFVYSFILHNVARQEKTLNGLSWRERFLGQE